MMKKGRVSKKQPFILPDNSLLSEKDKQRLLKRLWSGKKSSTKRRQLTIDITYEQFVELSLSPCGWCGGEPSNVLKYSDLRLAYNGIDRINSSKGYDWENCVPCCRFCNTLKAALPAAVWLDFINDVVYLHSGKEPYPGQLGINRNRMSFWKGR